MPNVKLLCFYCGYKNDKYVLLLDFIEEFCCKCGEKLGNKNILNEKSTDCYGYDYKKNKTY